MNQAPAAKPEPTVEGLIKAQTFMGLRIDRQQVIRAFFSSSASVTIAVLALIMISLWWEGALFVPTYKHELTDYRQCGLEYCDHIRKPVVENAELFGRIKRALGEEINAIAGTERTRRDAALLLKQQVEEKAVLKREALEEAIAAGNTPPEKLAELRQAVTVATTKAVEAATIPPHYTETEVTELRAALSALQPDVVEMPVIFQKLMADAAAKEREAKSQHEAFVDAVDLFEEAIEPIDELHVEMENAAKDLKLAAVNLHMAEDAIQKLNEAAAKAKTEKQKQFFLKDAATTSIVPINYPERLQPIVGRFPEYEKLVPAYMDAVRKAGAAVPKDVQNPIAKPLVAKFHQDLPKHLKHTEESLQHMRDWRWDKPVPLVQAATHFMFGTDWITNSAWQDFFGVVPLFTGSLMIALVALVVALPFSVAAAIYVNQFSTLKEQEIIKPFIEFIQAIPSVVLGFIGIAVLGETIRQFSQTPWLDWVPGFPIQERLNIFTAGLLLALMAVPTMFSLAEDALQNVPRAFSEASEALGATQLQTVFRVIVPASVSGILSAMLLGLGRIIGETMVVLLVAGNRIAIPNFSDGIGVVFQPAHTLTGIIAQELGEVSQGSSHWQALFMVGILLFFISLLINWLARAAAKRFQLPKI